MKSSANRGGSQKCRINFGQQLVRRSSSSDVSIVSDRSGRQWIRDRNVNVMTDHARTGRIESFLRKSNRTGWRFSFIRNRVFVELNQIVHTLGDLLTSYQVTIFGSQLESATEHGNQLTMHSENKVDKKEGDSDSFIGTQIKMDEKKVINFQN